MVDQTVIIASASAAALLLLIVVICCCVKSSNKKKKKKKKKTKEKEKEKEKQKKKRDVEKAASAKVSTKTSQKKPSLHEEKGAENKAFQNVSTESKPSDASKNTVGNLTIEAPDDGQKWEKVDIEYNPDIDSPVKPQKRDSLSKKGQQISAEVNLAESSHQPLGAASSASLHESPPSNRKLPTSASTFNPAKDSRYKEAYPVQVRTELGARIKSGSFTQYGEIPRASQPISPLAKESHYPPRTDHLYANSDRYFHHEEVPVQLHIVDHQRVKESELERHRSSVDAAVRESYRREQMSRTIKDPKYIEPISRDVRKEFNAALQVTRAEQSRSGSINVNQDNVVSPSIEDPKSFIRKYKEYQLRRDSEELRTLDVDGRPAVAPKPKVPTPDYLEEETVLPKAIKAREFRGPYGPEHLDDMNNPLTMPRGKASRLPLDT